MARTTKGASHYEILGVPRDAPAEQIRQRYREMALKLHPDRESSALAVEAMVLINNAYDILSDPKRREAYDAILKTEACSKAGRQARPELWTKMNGWKIQKIIAIALSAACLAGTQIGASHADEVYASGQFMETNRHYLSALAHEPLVAPPLFVPVLGLAWGVLGSFATGFVAKSVIMTVSGHVLPYAVLAAMTKLVAYYIGICRSMIIAIAIKRRHFARWDGRFALVDLVIVELLSLFAGYLEHAGAN